jgi:DNA polymerase
MHATPDARQIRQLIRTDQLLGPDAVPLRPGPGRGDPAGAPADKARDLAALEAQITEWVQANWPRDGWNRVVFGEGDPDARLMLIGEAPGAEEDAKGRPFVGRAGQLLDKQIAAMNLTRQQVYIGNIAKTRPPNNRVPTPEEAALWMPWLEKQIQIIGPTVIVSLGATSAKYLLDQPKLAITRVRGTWQTWRGIDLMPTFHPAYLLRSYTKDNRQRVWADLQAVMQRLGIARQ